ISRPVAPGAEDRERCLRLAGEISILRANLARQEIPREFNLPHCGERSDVPFLPVMEQTVTLLPHAFSGSGSQMDVFIPAPTDESAGQRLLVADAFSSSDHLKFAVRGMVASATCYLVYTAIDWRGLATSIATCIITALTTIGSSRQKEFLRLAGAIIGGLLAIGAQVFVLPNIDSIAGFTLLFMVVTAVAAWISTASARLSYAGVQLALAFYIVNTSEFTIQTSLAIARDRVFGVLLGLLAMGLIFDRFGARDALGELEAAFAQNLRDFAELTEQPLRPDRNAAVKRHRQLQDKINVGFDAVRAQSDGMLFEFGASRQKKLQIREDLKRWQPAMRTLLQVQNTFAHYRMQRPLEELPEQVADAESDFERDTALAARMMAEEVSGKASGPLPDITAAAERLENRIRSYYVERALPLTAEALDVITLTRTLASILGPLHNDIHSTFAQR
ncbi:MAG: FUSC family protein, partial [Acidobacteriaceae bacterium]|nr:FUSC family protein [Acidobacteriaceae bacterium]